MSILMCPWVCFQIRPDLGSNILRLTSSLVKRSSVVTIQIFDQSKLERRDQGFLGFVEIRVADYLDIELGGESMSSASDYLSPLITDL